jgi:hypothetical protein
MNEQAEMERRQSQQLCYKDLEHFITICNQGKILSSHHGTFSSTPGGLIPD